MSEFPCRLMLGALLLTAAGRLAAQEIAYPSPAAALAALAARDDVRITVQDGWTLADERAAHALWSFAPSAHAAYPAVVRRTVNEAQGQVSIATDMLCQGPQAACDALLAEFRRASAAMEQALRPQQPGPAKPWQPTPEQERRAGDAAMAYFAERDGQRYDAAYARLSESARHQSPFAAWRAAAQDDARRAGPVLRRAVKKVRVYRSAHEGSAATYAAVDFVGSFANADVYCAYLVLSEQADGSFRLLREEEHYIYKATDALLTPAQRTRMRSAFGCAD